MKIECTIRRASRTTPSSGTEVSFDGDDGAVVSLRAVNRGRATHRRGGRHRSCKRLLSITEALCPADDESAKLAAVVVTKKPEDDFVDPAISGKKYTQELLEAMKYKEVKKLAQERYGIELAADAKHADYVFAILNAQGV